jgi:branched chain amino acid efflux pump
VSSPRSELIAGARAELPILIGVIPWGLIYGVIAIGAGLPPAAALAMSSIVFAGSAQLIGAEQLGSGVPGPVIGLTTLVVNLRHMLYSASVAPYLKHLSARWKWVLAYLMTDEVYVVMISNYHRPGDLAYKHWFALGAGLTLWTSWQLSTAAGIFLGGQIPASWSLDFTLALTFIGLAVPALGDQASVAAAVAAGLAALLAFDLPLKLGLLLAAGVGITAGLAVESLRK